MSLLSEVKRSKLMSVLLGKTEVWGGRGGRIGARIDLCHFSPDRICFCLLRHLLNRAWNVSSFCGEDGERCRLKKNPYVGPASTSTMKLLEQPEQSIKWINALEPSVIQSVYVMKFWSYSSLVLLFSGSFISPAEADGGTLVSKLIRVMLIWF